MNKRLLGAGFFLIFGATACNNDLGIYTVGVPSPVLSLTAASGSLTAGQATVSYTIQAYTIPGSTGGTVQALITKTNKELPLGMSVDACPTLPKEAGGGLNQKNCGPFTSPAWTQSFPAISPDDFEIVGFRVQGQNGYSKVVQWTGSIPLLTQPSSDTGKVKLMAARSFSVGLGCTASENVTVAGVSPTYGYGVVEVTCSSATTIQLNIRTTKKTWPASSQGYGTVYTSPSSNSFGTSSGVRSGPTVFVSNGDATCTYFTSTVSRSGSTETYSSYSEASPNCSY